jgi:hypothetical protein
MPVSKVPCPPLLTKILLHTLLRNSISEHSEPRFQLGYHNLLELKYELNPLQLLL